MKVPLSWVRGVAAAMALVAGTSLFLLWQPARQVGLHTSNLLKRASDRNWAAVEGMISSDYRDAWGNDRAAAIDEARRLFSHFFALHIVLLEDPRIEWDGGEAAVFVRLGIYGTGTAIAEVVMDEVREAEGPFVFRWRKAGSRPWEWTLVHAGHGELARKYAR